MEKLTIRTHSVVDVITNSSTVIYSQADDGTISSVKDLINALLKIGGSELTADDLFNFELDSEGENYDGYQDVALVVTVKIDNEYAKIAANILNKLDDLFYHEANYDG